MSFPCFIIEGISQDFIDLYKENFIVIIGLPLAAFGALFLVVFLEQAQGPLEFKGLGFEFKVLQGLSSCGCYVILRLFYRLRFFGKVKCFRRQIELARVSWRHAYLIY